jgi:DNA-binding Lrp family transcriptional regulator
VLGLPVYNVYIVSYSEESVEEVEKELSKVARILSKSRSMVVRSFYYYRVDTSSEDEIPRVLKMYIDKGDISWYKIERTMG